MKNKNPAVKAITVVDLSPMSGQIWIGDPCYVIRDREWNTIVRLMFGDDEYSMDQMYEIEFSDGKRFQFFIWHAGDDGDYAVMVQNSKIGEVCVDSGSLSFMPTELVDRLMAIYPDNSGLAGCVVTVSSPEIPEAISKGGVLGSVSVPCEDPMLEEEEPEEEDTDDDSEDNDE